MRSRGLPTLNAPVRKETYPNFLELRQGERRRKRLLSTRMNKTAKAVYIADISDHFRAV
jgi:hypothetical protein